MVRFVCIVALLAALDPKSPVKAAAEVIEDEAPIVKSSSAGFDAKGMAEMMKKAMGGASGNKKVDASKLDEIFDMMSDFEMSDDPETQRLMEEAKAKVDAEVDAMSLDEIKAAYREMAGEEGDPITKMMDEKEEKELLAKMKSLGMGEEGFDPEAALGGMPAALKVPDFSTILGDESQMSESMKKINDMFNMMVDMYKDDPVMMEAMNMAMKEVDQEIKTMSLDEIKQKYREMQGEDGDAITRLMDETEMADQLKELNSIVGKVVKEE